MSGPPKRPTIIFIAGPNGAGKSTLYELRIKPRFNAPFVNADIIQRDELQDASPAASYKAAKIVTRRCQDYLDTQKSFVTESVFSHQSKLALIADAKAKGFRTVVYHISVNNPDLSVKRVELRVEEGGHNVPEKKVRERYLRNQPLIRAAILQADIGFIYDNSALNSPPVPLISFEHGAISKINDAVIPEWVKELYGRELAAFSGNK